MDYAFCVDSGEDEFPRYSQYGRDLMRQEKTNGGRGNDLGRSECRKIKTSYQDRTNHILRFSNKQDDTQQLGECRCMSGTRVATAIRPTSGTRVACQQAAQELLANKRHKSCWRGVAVGKRAHDGGLVCRCSNLLVS
jgi:hypothetical protein